MIDTEMISTIVSIFISIPMILVSVNNHVEGHILSGSSDTLLYYEQMVANVYQASEYLRHFDEHRRGLLAHLPHQSFLRQEYSEVASTRLKRTVRRQNGQCGCFCNLSFDLGACSGVKCHPPKILHPGNSSSDDCAPESIDTEDQSSGEAGENPGFAKDPADEQLSPDQPSSICSTEELFNMTSTTPSKPGPDFLDEIINPTEVNLDNDGASPYDGTAVGGNALLEGVTSPDFSSDTNIESSSKVVSPPGDDDIVPSDEPSTVYGIDPDDPESSNGPSPGGLPHPGKVTKPTHSSSPGVTMKPGTPGLVATSFPGGVTSSGGVTQNVDGPSPGDVTDLDEVTQSDGGPSPGDVTDSDDKTEITGGPSPGDVTDSDDVTEIAEGASPGDVTDPDDATNNPDDPSPEDATDNASADCQPSYGASGKKPLPAKVPSPDEPVVPQDYDSCSPASSGKAPSPDS